MATHGRASHQHYWDDKWEWPHVNKGWKQEKIKPNSVWTILKNCFLKIWKITMGTQYIYIYIYIYKDLILSKLQLQNFHENSPCFNSHFICLKHLGKTCRHVVFFFFFFFLSKFLFLHQMFSKPFQFFKKFDIFHKKGSMCSKH
jgi:hypothetical protein